MEIVLCIVISIIVSAVVSILMLKFFAYKYVRGIMEESQKSIRDTVSMLRNTAGRK